MRLAGLALASLLLTADCQTGPRESHAALTHALQQAITPAEARPHLVDAVAEANVRLVMRQIRERSPVLRELLDSGKAVLAGCLHDLRSGQVKFLND